MSNKPVLVLKDIQTLQTVGASKRPSFMGMLRTAVTGRDAQGDKVGRMRRLGNALGVGAKLSLEVQPPFKRLIQCKVVI